MNSNPGNGKRATSTKLRKEDSVQRGERAQILRWVKKQWQIQTLLQGIRQRQRQKSKYKDKDNAERGGRAQILRWVQRQRQRQRQRQIHRQIQRQIQAKDKPKDSNTQRVGRAQILRCGEWHSKLDPCYLGFFVYLWNFNPLLTGANVNKPITQAKNQRESGWGVDPSYVIFILHHLHHTSSPSYLIFTLHHLHHTSSSSCIIIQDIPYVIFTINHQQGIHHTSSSNISSSRRYHTPSSIALFSIRNTTKKLTLSQMVC